MRIKTFFLLILLGCSSALVLAQPGLWTDVPSANFTDADQARWAEPQKYRLVQLDIPALESVLRQVPGRFNPQKEHSVLALPMPDGTWQQFAIVESSIFHPELARKFPEIKTYSGQGVEDPAAAVYLDWTPQGFHAMILSPGKTSFIDPGFNNDRSYYFSYDKQDFQHKKSGYFSCGAEPSGSTNGPSPNLSPVSGDRSSTVSLRTYRLAMAATGEYTQYHGGSVAAAMAAIATTVNRVRGIYETELAVSFTLIANNDAIVYTNPAADPYSNPPLLAENQTNIDAVIGSANYDIGHVMSTGTGGIATVGSVCSASSKARGASSFTDPVGDPFVIDFVAHEIGHQFGAHHTLNGDAGSCTGAARNATTAYETGSGSTIMAYAGICGPQNVQFKTHSYFHRISLNEITTFVASGAGSSCPVTVATGNHPPSINADPAAMGGKYIPISTPFELTASGTDPDGDLLTYAWEQWDLGPAGAPSPTLTNGPVFRSMPPTANPARTFPALTKILENKQGDGEFLPSVTRGLNFECTVRDNAAGGGGNAAGSLSLQVTDVAGPFFIFSHNTPATVNGNITVQWNVANTTSAPVNCANVDILLSLDGGATFSPLLLNTPNDGSQAVTLPNTATGQARLKVKCSDNVFFDINNADLRIAPSGADCSELFTNGDMESGGSGWVEFSTNFGGGLIADWGNAHSGLFSAWLGFEDNETSQISKSVTIPAGALFANLAFWYKLERFDCGRDELRVKVNGVIVKSYNLCNDPGAAGWTRQLIDLSAYAGTTPTIMFESINDAANPSDFLIDDVSVYICEGAAFPLPVELLDFRVHASGTAAMLTWATASETNNQGFEIQMRSENTDFQPVGFVAGAVNSNERQDYRQVVPDLTPGVYYFRLRQMDMDGSANFTQVKTATISGGAHVSVQPNPAKGFAHFVLLLDAESEIKLEVLDLAGRTLGTVTNGTYASGKFQVGFDFENLPSGVYFYRLTGRGLMETGRFSVVK